MCSVNCVQSCDEFGGSFVVQWWLLLLVTNYYKWHLEIRYTVINVIKFKGMQQEKRYFTNKALNCLHRRQSQTRNRKEINLKNVVDILASVQCTTIWFVCPIKGRSLLLYGLSYHQRTIEIRFPR